MGMKLASHRRHRGLAAAPHLGPVPTGEVRFDAALHTAAELAPVPPRAEAAPESTDPELGAAV